MDLLEVCYQIPLFRSQRHHHHQNLLIPLRLQALNLHRLHQQMLLLRILSLNHLMLPMDQ